MDGSGARLARSRRRLVDEVEAAAPLAARLPAAVDRLEAETALEQVASSGRPRYVRAHAVRALEGQIARHLGVIGDERLVGYLDGQQLVLEALRVGKDEGAVLAAGLGALPCQPIGPEAERVADPTRHSTR